MYKENESFIKKTSLKCNISESVVEKIIKFQWEYVAKNLSKHNIIEVSGLCKFKVRPGVIKKKITKAENCLNTCEEDILKCMEEKKRRSYQISIDRYKEEIEHLKTKLE